jgi:hypothetical protein
MCCDKSLSVCHSGKCKKKVGIQSKSVHNGTTLYNVTNDDRKKSDKNKKRRGKKSSTSEICSKVPKVNVVPYELFRPTKKIVGDDFMTSDTDVSFGVKSNDAEDRPVYTCKVCERKLSTKSNLKSHLRIHTDERPYTCHVRGKQFRAWKGLNRHVKEVHEGLKEHNCDICERSFASKATRDDHRRIHTGERPYV